LEVCQLRLGTVFYSVAGKEKKEKIEVMAPVYSSLGVATVWMELLVG